MNRKAMVAALGLLGALHAYIVARHLPASAATHFDFSGRANGFMSPSIFFWFMAALYAVITAGFTLIPIGWMKIPNKAYWLAPERRSETEDYIWRNYGNMGLCTQLFMMAITWIIQEANRLEPPHLSNTFFFIVFIFIGYAIVWKVIFYLRFRKGAS